MKKLKEYSSLIIFVAVLFLDYKYQFLKSYLEDGTLIELVKVIGALLFAKTTESNLKTSIFAREEDETDIGGGGIKNPNNGG